MINDNMNNEKRKQRDADDDINRSTPHLGERPTVFSPDFDDMDDPSCDIDSMEDIMEESICIDFLDRMLPQNEPYFYKGSRTLFGSHEGGVVCVAYPMDPSNVSMIMPNLSVEFLDDYLRPLDCFGKTVRIDVVEESPLSCSGLSNGYWMLFWLTFHGDEGTFPPQFTVRIEDGAGNLVAVKTCNMIDVPRDYTTYLKPRNLLVFKKESADEEVDYEHTQSLIGADYHNLHALDIMLAVDQFALLEKVAGLEAVILFKSPSGKCVNCTVQNVDRQEMGEDNFYFFQDCIEQDFSREDCKGAYSLNVYLLGELMIDARFEVSDSDWEAPYQMGEIEPLLFKSGGGAVVSPRDISLDEAMEQLNRMVGLRRVKALVESYRNTQRLNTLRQNEGLPIINHALHGLFLGNPGTGKTTVAQLLGQIFHSMGLLSRGHVVTEERSTLIGQFYGSESEKTNKALEKAQGGILFIDEAYNLYVSQDPKDPGIRVLETLLSSLSNPDKRDWMLILGGYPRPMSDMLNANPGLRSKLKNIYYFDDYSRDELLQIADLYCDNHHYTFTPEARRRLSSVLRREMSLGDATFGNARFVERYIEDEVMDRFSRRLLDVKSPTRAQLTTIEADDVLPKSEVESRRGFEELEAMIGMERLKQSILSHLNFVRMANLRMEHGIHTELPPLHMIFTGNPGTGKSSVARFIGKIYASMGILSRGDVIVVERHDLVGSYVGETERKTADVMKQAKGNVLFIDEAYTLFSGDDSRDYGRNVVQTMLGTLGGDRIDMIVVLAGYKEEMDKLLDSNPGLRSRFPYTFHFDDYSCDELMSIASCVAAKNSYILDPSASKALRTAILREIKYKDRNFGNGRFVTRLITNVAAVSMANRVAALPENAITDEQLQTLTAADFPVTEGEIMKTTEGGFDEESIAAAFDDLDKMVGIPLIKSTLHNYVEISRYRRASGVAFTGEGLLRWSFAGKDGTGKSTVASLLARLLQAMNLIGSSEVVELKGERLLGLSSFELTEQLKSSLKEAGRGLLFIDCDSATFKEVKWPPFRRQLDTKLSSLNSKHPECRAVVLAERESPRQELAQSLAKEGAFDFDHTLIFPDYTPQELVRIFENRLQHYKLDLSPQAAARMDEYFTTLCASKLDEEANARTVKLLARTVADIATLRISRGGSAVKWSIEAVDVEMFKKESLRHIMGRIGY